MTSAEAPSGNAASCEFDLAGNRTKSAWGIGAYTYCSYDAVGRTERIRHLGSAGAALAYFDYSHNARGDVAKIARLDGLTTYYDYDEVGRLTYENWKEADGTSVYAFTYDYDLNGSRTKGSILGVATYWEYSEADPLVKKWTEPGPSEASYYSYDLDGNLELIKDRPGGSLTYFEHGSHGLVTRIHALNSDPVTFAYDGLLRRIRMAEGATATYFRHDGMNPLEVVMSDGTVTKITHGHPRVPGIGAVAEAVVDGVRHYLHQDHRGTIYTITDANENVVWTGLCDAWGRPLGETGTNPTVFWYQGQAWWRVDVGSQAYYVWPTRIYRPEDGRFLERDSAYGRGMGAGAFMFLPEMAPVVCPAYTYCGNMPVTGIDPRGLFRLQFEKKKDWKDEEERLVRRVIRKDVVKRVDVVRRQVDAKIKELCDECPDCYKGLIEKLNHLNTVLDGVKADVNSQKRLIVRKKDLGTGAPAMIDTPGRLLWTLTPILYLNDNENP